MTDSVIPHDNKRVIKIYHKSGTKEVGMAIHAALKVKDAWSL